MDLDLQIVDMAGAGPEHSLVIVNFVSAIRKQLRNSNCHVFSDNVQYKFKTAEGEGKQDNKKELQIIHFPNVKIAFDELFEEIE